MVTQIDDVVVSSSRFGAIRYSNASIAVCGNLIL